MYLGDQENVVEATFDDIHSGGSVRITSINLHLVFFSPDLLMQSQLDWFATDRHDIPDTKSERQLNFVVTANATVFERDKTGNP